MEAMTEGCNNSPAFSHCSLTRVQKSLASWLRRKAIGRQPFLLSPYWLPQELRIRRACWSRLKWGLGEKSLTWFPVGAVLLDQFPGDAFAGAVSTEVNQVIDLLAI